MRPGAMKNRALPWAGPTAPWLDVGTGVYVRNKHSELPKNSCLGFPVVGGRGQLALVREGSSRI